MPAHRKESRTTQMALRHTFVSMLFALAIAEVAIQTSNLVSIVGDRWANLGLISFLRDVPFSGVWLMIAPICHLVLVLIVICMSWVGWSRSIERGNARDVTKIFSVQFLLLLIELLLVISYFALARSIELTTSLSRGEQILPASIESPTATPEAFWILLIFTGYCIWDLFADALPRYYPKGKEPFSNCGRYVNWVVILFSGIIVRCFVSIMSAIAAYYVLARTSSGVKSPLEVAAADMALLCIVIWFWTAKGLEALLADKVLPWEKHRAGHRNMEAWRTSVKATFTLALAFVFFLIMM